MIDVSEQIKPLLTFDGPDDFYYLQILRRKKENETMNSNSEVIKNYYINSIEYLEYKYDEIKTLCNTFNARASLRLNRRSHKKVALDGLKKIADLIAANNYIFVRNVYSRSCGQVNNEPKKRWIVDIDHKEQLVIDGMIDYINEELRPEGPKVLMQLPTKNGVHLITHPFDLGVFRKVYSEEVHKDNPINLYIPNIQ